MSLTISDGGVVEQDKDEVRVYVFDWSTNLPAGIDLASVGTFLVTPLDNGGVSSYLTQDNELLLPGDQQTRVRLSGGVAGTTYTVTNRVTTAETPSQTKERSFKVRITQQA